jgi:hypothetical protein
MISLRTRSCLSGHLTRLLLISGAVALLLGGGVLAAVHVHAGDEGAGHCALCSLAGALASPAPRAPDPAPPELRQPKLVVHSQYRPAFAPVRLAPARAPPAA